MVTPSASGAFGEILSGSFELRNKRQGIWVSDLNGENAVKTKPTLDKFSSPVSFDRFPQALTLVRFSRFDLRFFQNSLTLPNDVAKVLVRFEKHFERIDK